MIQKIYVGYVREIILHVYKEGVDLQDSKKIIKNNFKKPGRFFQKNKNLAFQKAVDDFQKAMDDFQKAVDDFQKAWTIFKKLSNFFFQKARKCH